MKSFISEDSIEQTICNRLSLPEYGWEQINLFDVADVSYGYSFKSDLFCEDSNLNAVVRIRDIQDNATKTFTSEICDDKYIIEENKLFKHNQYLTHQRDLLLPRLMSGKLEVMVR